MVRINEHFGPELEAQLIRKLYGYMGYDLTWIEDDVLHDYLTANKGHNTLEHYWYMDETKCVAIDEDGNIIDYADNAQYFSDNF